MERIAVIGSGMAGMAAAQRLKSAGLQPVVFESNDRVGGRIWTIQKGDYLMDLGAAVYLGTYREAIELIHEVGLTSILRELPAIGSMPRNGKLHEFVYSTPIKTALTTKALSPAAKLRALRLVTMLLRNQKYLGYADYDKITALDTESTREYALRALGKELSDYATEPLVRGTWAADDGDSSNALMLWSLRNMLVPTVFSLDTGMDALARTVADGVEMRLSSEVTNVTDLGVSVEVTSKTVDGENTETFDGAIIATTAKPALSMFPQMDENHRTLYESARYRGLITVALGLNRKPTDRATYILMPRAEDPDVVAVIADHHKAVGRCPENKSLYTLLFSHEYLQRSREFSDQRLIDDAMAITSRYHGNIDGTLEETAIVRWDEVVPVLDTGRFTLIKHFQERLDPTMRVQFASDLDRIPGVNGALVSGLSAAKRVVDHRSAWSKTIIPAV